MSALEWNEACLENRKRFFQNVESGSLAIFFSQIPKNTYQVASYGDRSEPNFFYFCPLIESPAACILHKNRRGQTHTYLFREKITDERRAWSQAATDFTQGKGIKQLDGIYSYDTLMHSLYQWLNESDFFYVSLDEAISPVTLLIDIFNQVNAEKLRLGQPLLSLKDWKGLMSILRVQKTSFEIDQIKKSTELAVKAHLSVMKNIQNLDSEAEIMAQLYHQFIQHGAQGPAYPAIVAGAERGCMLHYHSNCEILESQAMVLVDAGCSYQGYASDITRTFPKSGVFSLEQRQIYELVLSMQVAAFEQIYVGSHFANLEAAAVRKLTEGLIELKLLSGDLEVLLAEQAYKQFYMHSIGHWIGLDVHDLGPYGKNKQWAFKENMVLTVEPGIYISAKLENPRYRGICVRIEDMVQVTASGYRNFSASLPKLADEIQAVCSQCKVLNA